VQSFNDAHLRRLGRIHQRDHVFKAVEDLKSSGFDNFNLDLMYGLPTQSTDEAIADLKNAIALQPTHLSHYQLALEPGTVFYHRPPALPSDDTTWDMHRASKDLLEQSGYAQYEVSAYARAGRQCQHNVNYWRFGDYIGVGAGAHGKLTRAADGAIIRTLRQKQPREYLQSSAVARLVERRELVASDLPFEFALNALRLREGFTEVLFESRTGLSIEAIKEPLARASNLGLLEFADELGRRSWRPTPRGVLYLNDLQMLFLP
jgi:oxygen-independent coproporphyrinogen-3 oxidase